MGQTRARGDALGRPDTCRAALIGYLESVGVSAEHAAQLADQVDPADPRTTAVTIPGPEVPIAGNVLGLKHVDPAGRLLALQRVRVEAVRPAAFGMWACAGVALAEMGGSVDALVTLTAGAAPVVQG